MTPTNTTQSNIGAAAASRPRISVASGDYARLTRLLETASGSEVVDYLSEELTRANIVPDDELGPQVARMGSEVTYRDDANGRTRKITLVYPQDADIAQNRVSVLTPIGAALIGLSPEESIDWPTPSGGRGVLTVINVNNEARA